MDERRGAATEGTAKAAAAKRTAARRKPTTKGGAKSVGGPAPGKSGTSAKPAASGAGRRSAESGQAQVPHSPLTAPGAEPQQQDRGMRRAIFLAELAEAKELRRRVAPRRARAAELHARVLRTFRY